MSEIIQKFRLVSYFMVLQNRLRVVGIIKLVFCDFPVTFLLVTSDQGMC